MNPVLLDGKKVADEIKKDLTLRVAKLKEKNRVPVLATILVGSDPASATYVRMKQKACETVGMLSRKVEMPQTTTTQELLQAIDALNQDPSVNGILLQHPVPHQIDERAAFDRILPEKDVDGVTTLGFGRISFGVPAYACCTPAGMIRLLKEYKIPLVGKHAVVIGRSPILGRPLSMLLLEENCTVTICHSKTTDIDEIVRSADLVMAGVGKPKFVRGTWIKDGAVVMDAGYNPGNIGDVDFEECAKKASCITPVPGGVGPMTITMLMEHTVQSAEKLIGL